MSHGAVLPSFGRFQALQLVRHDGAATHYAAFDPELKRSVALITGPVGPDAAEENRLAFRLPRMRHPNVVSVLDAGVQGDLAFVAAECVQTEPLSAFLARPGRMPFFQGLPLVLQLLSAIEHAQARRLVHAGIDLEQLQVTPGGQLKLPPAGWSLSADRQRNLEAAARIARIVLCGSCPPALRDALEQVLLRAEAPEPAARYQRADEFILALLAAAGYPVGVRSATEQARAIAEPQPVEPVKPLEPVVRTEPGMPVEPVHAAEPVLLADPVVGAKTSEPIEPVLVAEPVIEPKPTEPSEPIEPVLLVRPSEPVRPVLVAEPSAPMEPVLRASPVATRAVRPAPHRPLKRRRTGRHVIAAGLLAALLLPGWVGERVFDGSPGVTSSAQSIAMGASRAGVELVAMMQTAAAKLAPAAARETPTPATPAPVALAPVAPTPAAPEKLALASMTAPPVHTTAEPRAEETPALEPAPVETAPAAPSHAVPAQAAPSRAAPTAAARTTARPVAVAPRSPAPKQVARSVEPRPPAHARLLASAEPVRARPGTTHVHAARPRPARVVTAASGCPYDVPVFRELCEARQCNRFELRNDPTCVRMRSEQRAALARLRGTPD